MCCRPAELPSWGLEANGAARHPLQENDCQGDHVESPLRQGTLPGSERDLTSSHWVTRWVMAFNSAMAFSSWKSKGKASVHSLSSCTILAEKDFSLAWVRAGKVRSMALLTHPHRTCVPCPDTGLSATR